MAFLRLALLVLLPFTARAWYNTNYVPVGYSYPAFWQGAGLQQTVTYQWSNNTRTYWPSYVYNETQVAINGLDNTGATDVTSGLQSAYNSLGGVSGSPQAGVLPAGTFMINSTLILNRDFNSLRGTIVPVNGIGSNATVLLYSTNNSPGPHVLTVGRSDGTAGNTYNYQYTINHTNLLFTDALRGSSNIVLASATLADLNVGDKFLIDRLPDVTNSWYTYAGVEPPVYDQCAGVNSGVGTLITWGGRYDPGSVVNSNRNCAQVCVVTAVANTTNITFWPPLHAAYSNAYSPNVIKAVGLTTNVFLEAVTVDMNQAIRTPGWGWNGIYLNGGYQSGVWNVNVVQTNGPQTTLHIHGGLWCQIEHSFFTLDGTVSGNSQAYGNYCVSPHTSFAWLNNIYGTNEVAIGEEGGDSGDVIFGNCMNNLVYNDSGVTKRDWGPAHGGFNHLNLIEQNYCPQSYLDVDNYQGNHGMLYFFRNYSGTVTNSVMINGFTCAENWGKNWYCTYQANFFGETNVETLFARTGGAYSSQNNVPGSANPPVVFHAGYQSSIANGGVAVDFTFPEMTNYPQLMWHENWDYVGNAVRYATNVVDQTAPNSLYTATVPTWWGNLTWPMNTLSGTVPGQNSNPAGYRFYHGTLPANSYFFGPDPSPAGTTTPPIGSDDTIGNGSFLGSGTRTL